MNPAIELIQPVLPTSTYNTLFDCICSRHYFLYMTCLPSGLVLILLYILFNACLLDLSTRYITSVHVCLPVHATWLHFMYALDCFWQPLDLHVQILEFRPWWTSCC